MAYLLDRKHKPCRSVSQVYNRRVESTKYVHVLFRPPRVPLASAASEWHKRPGEAPGEVACRTSRSSAAGRGPLAGPVVAAAVVIDRRRFRGELRRALDDSKALSREVREGCYRALIGCARIGTVSIGIGAASRCEIDRI